MSSEALISFTDTLSAVWIGTLENKSTYAKRGAISCPNVLENNLLCLPARIAPWPVSIPREISMLSDENTLDAHSIRNDLENL